MRKRLVKIVALVLVAVMVLGTAAFAIDTRASKYIFLTEASIIPAGGGNMKIEFTVTGTGVMSKIGASNVTVYNSNGTSVASYSYLTQGNEAMMGANTVAYTSSVDYKGVPGQTYYAIVTCFCQNSSGMDSYAHTTRSVTV